MVSGSQIREKIAQFLAKSIDLDSFEDWIVEYTWNVHQSGSTAAEDVTFAIEELLSEYSSRQITDRDLRHGLLEILNAENKIMNVIEVPRPIYSFRVSAPVAFVPARAQV